MGWSGRASRDGPLISDETAHEWGTRFVAVPKHGQEQKQISPLRCAPVEMTGFGVRSRKAKVDSTLQQWLQRTSDILRDMLIALRRCMNAVILNVAGYAEHILINQRIQRHASLFGDRGIHGIEARDVVLTIRWWQRNAGEQHLGSTRMNRCDHAGEVLLRFR